MKKKLFSIMLVFSMLFSFFTFEAFAASNGNRGTEKKDTETASLAESETITRAEWIHELVEIFDLSIDEEEYPDNYYSDITEDSDCYADVMAATWDGILAVEAGDPVNPEEALTREFAAQTLNHELGVMCSEDSYAFSDVESVTFPDDAQAAVENEWFELIDGKFIPEQVVTQEEHDNMIAFARELLNDRSVEEAEANFEFADYVIEIPEEADVLADIDWENKNTTLTISGYNGELKENDTFVYYGQGLAFVYSVASVEKNGDVITVVTKDAPDDAIARYECVGDVVPEFEAVLPEDNEEVTMMSADGETVTFGKVELAGKHIDGFETYRSIRIGNISGKITARFDNLRVKYSLKKNKYVAVVGDVSLESTLKLDLLADHDAAHLPLGGIDLQGLGYVGAELQLDMHVGIGYFYKGSFKLGAAYNKGNGGGIRGSGSISAIKSLKTKDSGLEAEGEVSAQVALTARISVPVLARAEASVGIGPTVSAKAKYYFQGTPKCCVTIAGYLKAGGKVSAYFFGSDYEHYQKFSIFDESNSPIRVYVHAEDGKQVSKCTRPNDPGTEVTGYKVPRYLTKARSRFYGGWSNTSGSWEENEEPVIIWETSDNDDGTVTITGYHGNAAVLTIPEIIDDKTVSAIGSKVFQNNKRLRIVSMPDTITRIGSSAFSGCSNLSSIEFSKNLTRIDESAFSSTALKEAILPEGLTELGYSGRGYVFSGCKALEKVYIPSTLERIGCPYSNVTLVNYYGDGGNFSGCPNLQKVSFGEPMLVIPPGLFANCNGLTSVVIPDTVTTIDECAFCGCENLQQVSLGENVSEIGNRAFSGTDLKKVDLPEGLLALKGSVFSGCKSLQEVYIPTTLESTGAGSSGGNFAGCSSLNKVEFGEPIATIPGGLFSGCDGLTSIDIPDTVTRIGAYAFYNCEKLEEVDFDESVTVIGDHAFQATALKKAILPEGLTGLGLGSGGYAFANCKALEEVYIPATLVNIGHPVGNVTLSDYYMNGGNFSGCSNLSKVTFGDGIVFIPKGLFANCDGLSKIVVPDTVTKIGEYAFSGSSLEDIEIPDSVSSYESGVFYKCKKLTSIKLSNNALYIPGGFFSECESLEEITLPDGVTEIHSSTFSKCASLKKVNIPDSVTTIGEYAFSDCNSLTDVSMLPETVITIQNNAFRNCLGIVSVDLPDLVSSLGSDCFSGCTSLESFKASNDLLTIYGSCFKGDTKLTKIELNEGLNKIGENAFQGCTALEEVVMPDTVTSLGSYAFQKDTSLKAVTLSKGLTVIPSYAFANCICKEFTSLIIPNGVKTIKDHAFYQDAYLKTFTIPSSVTSIENEAFSYVPSTTVNGIAGSYAESYAKWKVFNDITKSAEEISLASGKDEMTIANGKTVTPLFNYVPEGSTDTVTLTSDNTKVVSVSSGNMLYGKAAGTANITATSESGKTLTFPVKVRYLSSIEIAEEPDQLFYAVKEDKNLRGFVVNAVFDNGDKEQIYDYTVSGFTTDSEGIKTVKVTYENKTATFEINVGNKDIDVVTHNISLTGNIGVNFYFKLSDKVLNDSGAKVVFSMPNNKTSEVSILKGTKRQYGDGYVYGYSCEVTSTQMTGTVTAKVVLSDGTESDEFPYTVKEYADIVIANKNNSEAFAKATPLVKAMLNYGSYSQQFFQYDDSIFANVDLTDAEKDVSEVTAADLEQFVAIKSGKEKGLVFQGSTLVLKSETSIRHYFSVEDGYSISDFTFQCDGKTLTPVASGKMYYVEIPNIASGDLDTMYEVTVGGFSIKYSALTYAYNKLVKTDTEEALQNLCRAMYLYNQAANTYFGK